ncbi:U3 snoRNP protein [Coemansia sp. RSA 2611]|nr:U3 snoRNP protein [Coemansia sp. RSA 2611]
MSDQTQAKRSLRAADGQERRPKRSKEDGGKTRTETDLEMLVFGADEDESGGVFTKIGQEQRAGRSADEPVPVSDEGSSDEGSNSEGGGAEGGAPLFFVDTERDAPDWASSSEDEGEEDEAGGDADKAPSAAWEDDDTQNATVALTAQARTRKLRVAEDEDEVGGDVYEQRLRRQFEQINPAPAWAGGSATADASLLQTSASLVARKRAQLAPGVLDIARVRNANQASESQSAVLSAEFHPTASVLLTAGMDKTLRLFEVDGKQNQKIQSLHLRDLPITAAQFVRGGQEIVACGRRSWYYAVDVEHASVMRLSSIPGVPKLKSLEHMRASANGDRLAFMGNSGQIHVVAARTKQFVATLPMNGAVSDAAFTADGNGLWSIGADNEVYQWDLRMNRCLSRWHDASPFRPTCLDISRDASYYASGDHAGVVNIYDTRAVRADHEDRAFFGVKPLKCIDNLTTAVHGVRFNHSAELLAVYSRRKPGQLRLVHLPTASVFTNWPASVSNLGHVQCVAFSPQSGFMAVGNDAGKALLYRLQHYTSY